MPVSPRKRKSELRGAKQAESERSLQRLSLEEGCRERLVEALRQLEEETQVCVCVCVRVFSCVCVCVCACVCVCFVLT